MSEIKTKNIFIISVAVFTLLLTIVPRGFITSDLGNNVLTVNTFLFGILSGFYIVVTTTDYNSIKSIAAQETGLLIALCQNISVYNQKRAKGFYKLVDIYIRRSLDYSFIEYPRETIKEYEAIRQAVRSIPITNRGSWLHQSIMGNLDNFVAARQQLVALATRSLSGFQWVVLYALALMTIGTLYGLRNGELFYDIIVVMVSSSIILILSLIRDIDSYLWNEKTFAFDVYENVFRSINELPYYPQEYINDGTVHPLDIQYRVGILTNKKTFARKIQIISGQKKNY